MAQVRLPRYVRVVRRKDGRIGYFWTVPSWARGRKGEPAPEKFGRRCPVDSEALGIDLATAIGKADLLNRMLDDWRLGAEGKPAEGTIRALFGWYRGLERFKKLSFKASRDYRAYMDKLEAFSLKTTTLGERKAAEVTAAHADKIYAAFTKDRGPRAGAYAMQICRRVWNEAVRHRKVAANPFAKMGIKTGTQKGNRATSRAEYDLFRAKAREMGYQPMATAAAISFELVRRVTDVFGFEFDDDIERGFYWEDYAPGEIFAMRQGKTGDRQVIPLRGAAEQLESGVYGPPRPGALLYPDLEAELARMTRGQGQIVLNAKGQRYDEDQAGRIFRKIRDAAGLPKEMTLTGFRHGGASELGDAGVYDIRAVSGHRTLQQTATYNKANESKARSAGEARRRHVGGN